jgi:hypothetical protein
MLGAIGLEKANVKCIAIDAVDLEPAQGAQQECMSSFFSPLGVCNLGRS